MNLPHLDPLIFAKEVVASNEKKASVLCDFVHKPSLAMFIEAAAQSSAALTNSLQVSQIGFVTVVKGVKLLSPIEQSHFLINVTCEVELQNLRQLSFEAFDKKDGEKIVEGNFTVFTQESL